MAEPVTAKNPFSVQDPDAKVDITLYQEAKRLREPYEQDYKMAAAYCRPRSFNVWTHGSNPANQGRVTEAKRYAYDSTGVNALPKFTAILTRLLTPTNMRYQGLSPSDPKLRKSRRVREYFETVNDRLFQFRYAPRARFIVGSSELYNSIGIYGMGPLYVGKRKRSYMDPRGGTFYKACRFYDTYVLLDDEGNTWAVFRRFWLNARQFKLKFPKGPTPKLIEKELKKPDPSETTYFEFVHIVKARDNYNPKVLGLHKPWIGKYAAVEDKMYVGEEENFAALPYIIPRADTDSDEIYSYSPALQALPAMGSLNAMKKTVLKQGQKAVDPSLLTYDDGVLNSGIDNRPGKIIHGGLNAQGQEMVKALKTGDFQVAEKLIEDERRDVNDAFYATLFQLLTENPNMTATAVIELIGEKSAMIAPLMGRAQAEYLGPMTEAELVNLTEEGFFSDLELPPELVEAKGEYEIVYTSPLAKGLYAEEVSGFLRTFESAANAAKLSGDQSILDPFNLKVAIPEIADRQSVPARWMCDEKEQAEKADARAKSQQQQMVVENAPGLAGAAKAINEMQNGGGKQAA